MVKIKKIWAEETEEKVAQYIEKKIMFVILKENIILFKGVDFVEKKLRSLQMVWSATDYFRFEEWRLEGEKQHLSEFVGAMMNSQQLPRVCFDNQLCKTPNQPLNFYMRKYLCWGKNIAQIPERRRKRVIFFWGRIKCNISYLKESKFIKIQISSTLVQSKLNRMSNAKQR